MERYNGIPRINGKLKTVRFPVIQPNDNDTIIISRDSDRLDLIAQQYYGDQTLYWIIAISNGLGKGSVEIKPGTTIRIPSNHLEIVRNYINLNL